MRFLLTSEAYHRVGGTETYVLTVAEQLVRLGHQARVYTPHPGDMADLSRARGIEVVGALGGLGDPDDVVLAQDAATSYDLMGLWPDVPQVYVSHSGAFDIQQVPVVKGAVQAVVVLSERFALRADALNADLRLVRMRQPIDTEWLVPRGEPSARPRRALLLGNYLDGQSRKLLVDVWSAQGVEVTQVGTSTTPTLHPRDDIAAADIVVGKGRAVLDAMSCGRPAYLYDVHGADGWVTGETYAAIEADAFAGQATPGVVDADRLRRDLAAYDPAMGHVNRHLVLQHHAARGHADDLVRLARELVPGVPRGLDQADELARQLRLRWRAEVEVLDLQKSLAAQEQSVKDALAEAAEARRHRDRARARGRRLATSHRSLQQQAWVRLGRRFRMVRAR